MGEFTTFSPPIDPEMHGMLAIVFTIIGFSLMAYYFAALSSPKSTVGTELVIGASSSVFLGFGVLFTFLTVGLWV